MTPFFSGGRRRRSILLISLTLAFASASCGGIEAQLNETETLRSWQWRPGFESAWLRSAPGDNADWRTTTLPRKLSGDLVPAEYKGSVTLRTRIPTALAERLLAGEPLALNAGRTLDVSRFYINARSFGGYGVVAPYQPGAMRPFLHDVPVGNLLRDQPNYLYIVLHTNGEYPLQFMDPILFGPSDQVYRAFAYLEALAMALVTLYLLAGGYHLMLYLRRPKDVYNLLFGLFGVGIGLYWFISNTSLRDVLFGEAVAWHRKSEHIALFLLGPLFVNFLTQFLERRYYRIGLAYAGLGAVLILATAAGPLSLMRLCRDVYYGSLLCACAFSLYYAGRAAWRGDREARFLLGGLIAFLFGLASDVLTSLDLIRFPRVTSYALLAVVAAMTYTLVRRYVQSSMRAEDLSFSLEQKIVDRTEALKASQAALSLTLNSVQGMVYRGRNDAARTLDYVSSGVRELTGYDPEDVAGRPLFGNHIIYEEDRALVRERIARALGEQVGFELEYRIQHADGSVRWALERGQGVYDDSGRLLHLQGFVTDITERKTTERKLQIAHDASERSRALSEESAQRLEQARQESDRMREEIEKLNEFMKKLNESTDLNTVLLQIFTHMLFTFNIDGVWLLFVDRKTNELYTNHESFAFATAIPDSAIQFLRTFRCPISPDNVSFWRTVRKRKPLFVRRLKPELSHGMERKLIDLVPMTGFVMTPLIVQDQVIGVLTFTQLRGEKLSLRPRDMAGAYRFAEQIGGALYSASLLEQVREERARSDRLLLNILPQKVAIELREQGAVKPVQYDQVTVLFTDFVGFTRIAERITADELLSELDGCFSQFDDVIAHHGLEKLKTIGDAYMCCGGLPEPNQTHAIDACLAALEFQNFMRQMREIKAQLGYDFWELRVGLNSGPVMAGVVGKNKFAYDIWGDTVNTASRMESAGSPGRVNISRSTYDQVKYFFKVERRGLVEAKGKGRMEMFFIKGLRSFVSRNGDGLTPNDEFYRLYNIVKSGGKLRFRREVEPAAGVEAV